MPVAYEPPSVQVNEDSRFESVVSLLAAMGDINVSRENNEYRINLVMPTGAMISRRGENLYEELLQLSRAALPVVIQPAHDTRTVPVGTPIGNPMDPISADEALVLQAAYLHSRPDNELANMLDMASGHQDRRFYTPSGSIHADFIREEMLMRRRNQATQVSHEVSENEFVTWFDELRPVATQPQALENLQFTAERYLGSLSRPARMDAFHAELKILIGELKRTLRRNDDAAIYQEGFTGSSNPEMYETTEQYKRQTLNLTLAIKRMFNFLQTSNRFSQATDFHVFLNRLLRSIGIPIFRCASLSTAKVIVTGVQSLPYRTRLGLAYMLYRELDIRSDVLVRYNPVQIDDWKEYMDRQQRRAGNNIPTPTPAPNLYGSIGSIVQHLRELDDTQLRNYHSMAANDGNRNVMTTGFGAISYDLIDEELNRRIVAGYGEEPYTGQTTQPSPPDEAQAEAEAISAVGLHEIAEVEREHEAITYADLVRDRPIADIAFYTARAQDLQRRLTSHPPDRVVPQEVEIREHLILYCKRLVWLLNDEAAVIGVIGVRPVSRKINGVADSLRVFRDTLGITWFLPQSVASNWERPYMQTVEEIGEKLSHIIAPEDAYHITTALKVLRAISKEHIMRKLAVRPVQEQMQEQVQTDIRTHEINVYNSFMAQPLVDSTTGQRLANMDEVIRGLRIMAGSGRLAQPMYLKINFLVEKVKDLIRSNIDVDIVHLARLMKVVSDDIQNPMQVDVSVTGWAAYLNVIVNWLGTALAGGRDIFAGIGGQNAGMLMHSIMLLEERKKVGLVSIFARRMGSRNVLFSGSDQGASGSWRRLDDDTPSRPEIEVMQPEPVPSLNAYAVQQRERITHLLESDTATSTQRMERLRTAEASLTQMVNNASPRTPDNTIEIMEKMHHLCINIRDAVTEDRVLRRTGQATTVTAAGPFTMELARRVKDLVNRLEISFNDGVTRNWQDLFRDYMNKLAYEISPVIGADDTFYILSGFNSLSQAACQVIMHVVEDNVSHPGVVAQETQERLGRRTAIGDALVDLMQSHNRTVRSNDPVPENEEI